MTKHYNQCCWQNIIIPLSVPTLVCNEHFNRAPQGLLQRLPIPGKIWDCISIDFITHLPVCSGKATGLVVVDRLSKHGQFCTLGNKFTATQVAEVFICNIIKLHGFPSSIVSVGILDLM